MMLSTLKFCCGATAMPADGVAFTTMDDFFQSLHTTSQDQLVFYGVSKHTLQRITRECTTSGLSVRLERDAAARRLLVTIPAKRHHVAHVTLYACVQETMGRRLRRQWSHLGASRFGRQTAGSSGCPQVRADVDRWPTLVLDAGAAASRDVLRAGMQSWFAASEDAVKMVLLVQLDVARRTILLEKYTQERPSSYPWAALASYCQQAIVMEQLDDGSIAVTGEPLLLEFHLLFLRLPNTSEGESDLLIRLSELHEYAAEVFRYY